MSHPASIAIFLAVFTASAGLFALNVQRLARYARLGLPDDRTNDPRTRIKNLLSIGIAQSKIFREEPAGLMHATIFWGFVVLTAGTAEIMIQGVFPRLLVRVVSPEADLPPLFVFAGRFRGARHRRRGVRALSPAGDSPGAPRGGQARAHRCADHPELDRRADGDVAARQRVCVSRRDRGGDIGPEKVVSRAVAGVIAPSVTNAAAFATGFWWSHVLLVLIFLNYLPYSKHLHVVTSLFNVYLSNTSGPGTRGAMKPMDLEAENAQFGAADVEQLSWKNLLDGYSCTECGRCTAACPANITGKALSPRKIVINTRQRLMEKGPVATGDWMAFKGPALAHETAAVASAEAGESGGHRLLDGYITEEELWACTSCRACVQECPVSIDQLEIINELRRNLVLSESRFPEEIQPAFESLERNGSPWAFNPADRADWARGMNVRTMAEMAERGERPDVLFWVGCMGSFDDRAKKITVAFARILEACNVSFAILGQEEHCHGDPARRMGNEYLYQMLAKDTIETLDRYRVQTIVTSCPHCFHQIGNEFPQLGGNYEVIHHSTYIERLLSEHRVPLESENGRRLTVAYHDSCYLGRYNDIYDAPRETLRRALPVVELLEPKRTRDRGLCCGAGGGRMFMEERTGKRINVERTEELLALEPDRIAVACPFCMTMMSDGVKAAHSSVPVVDIAEVVAERLATT